MGNITTNPQIPQHTLKSVLLLVALLWGSLLLAQQKVNKKAEKLYDESTELLHWDKFDEAEELLQKALEIQPDYVLALQRLGYTYYQNGKYTEAHQYIQKLIKVAPDHSKEAYFYLARTSLATLNFDQGLQSLDTYREIGAINEKRANELRLLEQNLRFAKNSIKDSFELELINAGPDVNTPDNEYFPATTADGKYLYFTRQKRFGIRSQEDIMISEWSDNGWQGAFSVSPNVNTDGANQGAHSISPDGKYLFFTQCEAAGGYGGCDIYVSRKQSGVWSKPVNLGPNINTKYKETQPCISPNGLQLFFVSSREGGLGKLDIWVSTLQPDGSWGPPQNLGPNVNTAEIDERPYLHTDNRTLYFSSDGHPGFGDADIYLSRFEEGTWSEAQNLGYPLNSYNYEGGIFVERQGDQAYFATDKYSANGDLDIYHFPLPPAARPIPVTYVQGTVSDRHSGQSLEAVITFTDIATGMEVNKVLSEKDGSFFLTLPTGSAYALNISKPGYLFHSQHFSLESVQASIPYALKIELHPVEVGETLVLNNIFFEKNKYGLKAESTAELDDLVDFLELNPSVVLEISGHTDSTGSAAINKELSQERANSVVAYLTVKGINPKRLKAKGYGSTKPVADNSTFAGRALNRRTEIKVIGK